MGNFFKSLFSGKSEETEESRIRSEKKNFEIFKYDGLRAQKMGKPEYAVKCFKEAIAIEEEFETLGYLANVYILLGELSKAREVLQRMAELEPELESTFITTANVCFMQEDYSAMSDACQKAFLIKDDNPGTYFLFAKANRGLKDEINTIAMLTRAISLKEDYNEALLLRSEVLWEMCQFAEAEADVEALLKLNSEDEQAILLKGHIKEATGNEEEAELCYNEVIEINPFNEQAYLCLGQVLINGKKFDEAVEKLDEAIEINPDFAKAYHERGRAKLLNGDKEGSIKDMKKSLELSSDEAAKVSGEFNNFSDLYANRPL